jgi:TolB protein
MMLLKPPVYAAAKAAIFVSLVCLSSFGWAAATLDTIIIDAGYDKQTRIAVVPFGMGPGLGDEVSVSDVVAFDLARSGQFAPLERDNLLSRPTARSEVFFRDWRILGIEYLVIGTSELQTDGLVEVKFMLFDVVNEREMHLDEMSVPRAKMRDAAHVISDAVFEKITGIPGAFSTRLIYVLAKDQGTRGESFSLEMADSDGERARTLFTSTEPLMSASWSPDASKVAYVSFETGRPTIVVQDVVTGSREIVTQFAGINSAPVFSPDGKQLALVLSRDGNPEIYTMTLLDRRMRRITRHHAIDTEPSWTPDGKSLIFTSDRAGQPQIYQVELATNLIERLTFEGSYNARARLLPDGKHLVYVHRREGVFHIAWQDLERDDVRVLTQSDLDESPSLAPNGTMLIYATQDRGKGILAVVSIDGRVKYRLPSSSGDVREPAWSPFIDTLRSNI